MYQQIDIILVAASNLFCQSCPGATVNGVPAIFANTALTGCVASIGNCSRSTLWTNADCLACNGNTAQYAKANQTSCQATAPPSADVNCSAATCTTAGTCQAAPTTPSGLSWQNGSTSGKCAINNCPASTSLGLVAASDLFCQSCPGATVNGVPAIFANTALTGCVASTGNCSRSTLWTNADCLACNGNTAQYAKANQSGCQATAPPPGADVNCSAATCKTAGTCIAAPTTPQQQQLLLLLLQQTQQQF
ncbi:cell surface immobilization antigen (macronuclear) [Tetrahymena thermophila SB210]|uniref:Cell surface immobilization antigen n=1 Tax=Tetrahymena thermophila (strain SB210) TaxID=312017 RepID=Q235R9_TETTS|nr:cell surface immobilization antigen [Tetrahymena thermophila SB210]EAR92287.2 cell surface immobilization antigen [Tetrahymena thermophila SB210]|eukprot:XP_001012532.2 cell surface immobilization antigen [Tetrahymena thermophila SB210]